MSQQGKLSGNAREEGGPGDPMSNDSACYRSLTSPGGLRSVLEEIPELEP